MAGANSNTAYPAAVYETFDAFMQQVIQDTHARGAKRPEFGALVLASGELLPMAWGRVTVNVSPAEHGAGPGAGRHCRGGARPGGGQVVADPVGA